MRRNLTLFLVLFSMFAAACSSSSDDTTEAAANDDVAPTEAASSEPETGETETGEPEAPVPTPGPRIAAVIDPASVPTGERRDFGPAPDVPSGDLAPEVFEAIDTLMGERLLRGVIDELSFEAISTLGASGDARVAWWLTDLLPFLRDPALVGLLIDALQELLDIEIDLFTARGDTTDRLIGWDIPAPPEYLKFKRNIYVVVDARWEPLFEDGSDIDWRLVSWGGVFIDDRPFDRTDFRCNSCIPAADNPITTDVAGGDEWLDDDTILFGVSINGEHRAYPRSIMEVRELVNDTLGGRDFAMPYCTLCGSAQVFFTDEVADGIERPVMRTSGLLSRSNKVMFDVNTFSVFDTFLARRSVARSSKRVLS